MTRLCVETCKNALGIIPGTEQTYTCTAHENYEKGLHNSSHAHNPRETEEEDDSENVLETWQVHPHQRAHIW